MRRVNFGMPPANLKVSPELQWVLQALKEVELASYEYDPASIASGFTISNYTETRTLNAATATATEIANVLATLILDLRRGGAKKG